MFKFIVVLLFSISAFSNEIIVCNHTLRDGAWVGSDSGWGFDLEVGVKQQVWSKHFAESPERVVCQNITALDDSGRVLIESYDWQAKNFTNTRCDEIAGEDLKQLATDAELLGPGESARILTSFDLSKPGIQAHSLTTYMLGDDEDGFFQNMSFGGQFQFVVNKCYKMRPETF